MKHLLVIHMEKKSRRRHFEALRRYGAKIFLIKAHPSWEQQYVDVAIDVDTRSIEKSVTAAVALHRDHRIDAIITFAEYSVPTAAAIARTLNLPFISEATAHRARNKFAMRAAFAKAGLPGPQTAIATSCDEAVKRATTIGYPVVLKPLIGGGSYHIRRIDSTAEMREHFADLQDKAWHHFRFDPLYQQTLDHYGKALLIESYLHGGEISVESIVFRETTHTIAIHDKPLPMHGPYFEERYFTTPSRLPPEVQHEVLRQTALANHALGIHMGATHTEFRITETGPVLLETAARLGGAAVYRSILHSTGVDMVHALIDVAFGKQPRVQPLARRPTGFYCFFAKTEGLFKNFHVDYTQQWDDAVVEVEMYKSRGERLLLPPNGFESHGHIIFSAATLNTIDAVADDTLNRMSIETTHD